MSRRFGIVGAIDRFLRPFRATKGGSNRGCSGITKVDTGHGNGFKGPVLITVMVDHTGQGTGSVRVRSRGRVSHAFMRQSYVRNY